MFATFQNAVDLRFRLVPDGPILVRSGTAGLDPGVAEMEFQRTRRGGRSTVFLAGSGLKGVLRAHAERLLRTAGLFACDPFARPPRKMLREELSCSAWRAEADERDPNRPFNGQCPACFTFGSLNLAGRFRVQDAYPADGRWEETNATEQRTQVGIDRRSGGSSGGALFDVEVVVGGGFEARATGENFALWQVALFLQVLRDLDDGLVHVGGCKARGMGAVKVEGLTLRFLDAGGRRGEIRGARPTDGWADGGPPEEPFAYDRTDAAAVRFEEAGLFEAVVFSTDAAQAVAGGLIRGPLRTFLERSGRPARRG
jgi:CRISPR-associated RAMP protein (TIGR02581 family)